MSNRAPYALAAAGVAFALVGLYVWRKGGIAPAAAAAGQAIGGGAVSAVGGVANGVTTGIANGIGGIFGLPSTDETTGDPKVARWIIDNAGQLSASAWSSAWAYLRAQTMPAGSGTPPALNTPAGQHFKYLIGAANWTQYTNDETARLLARYPAPVTTKQNESWELFPF